MRGKDVSWIVWYMALAFLCYKMSVLHEKKNTNTNTWFGVFGTFNLKPDWII